MIETKHGRGKVAQGAFKSGELRLTSRGWIYGESFSLFCGWTDAGSSNSTFGERHAAGKVL